MIKIIEDKGQKIDKHIIKNQWWKENGIVVERYPLPIADYVLVNEKIQDVIDRKNARGLNPEKMDFVGTYTIAVDTKKDIQELIQDVCTKDHARFKDECILAQNNGVKLYILVEDAGGYVDKKQTIYNYPVTCVEDLPHWKNPRLFIWRNGKQAYPTATKGLTLFKCLKTMEEKYGCKFLFTKPECSAKKVIDILTMAEDMDVLM